MADLRGFGWQLEPVADRISAGAVPHPPAEDAPCVWLGDARLIDTHSWLALVDPAHSQHRGRVLLLGLANPFERADLLRMGFGEALPPQATRGEIAVRAARVADRLGRIARRRRCGPLVLDLVRRDGMVGDRPLRLNPREFALLWRLMDSPGVAVSKAALLRDVWHLRFQPETNSLAVHASRMRAKLALAGLEGIVQTAPDGGYLLVPGPPRDLGQPANPDQPLLERAAWNTVLPWEQSS